MDKTVHNEPIKLELLYTSDMYNTVYLGQASTLGYGGLCLLLAPILFIFKIDTEFIFLQSLLFRSIISSSLVGVGFTRWRIELKWGVNGTGGVGWAM